TPPLGLMPVHLRADDGIRTRDPHLGKVMRYQLRYIRAPRTTSSPVAKDDDSPLKRSCTNLNSGTRVLVPGEVRTVDMPAVKSRSRDWSGYHGT
ncbi:MAG: hypothetical protein QOF47_3306, partial [Mycobacterium sp.]|nr:hypothetical protein [Mycobacterium sp.]